MLLAGINDSDEDVARLIRILGNKPLKLIISSYNDNNMNGLKPTNTLEVLEFYYKIKENIDSDVFHSFGGDVLGGCGQLTRAAAAP